MSGYTLVIPDGLAEGTESKKSKISEANFISVIGHRGAGARSINKTAKGRPIYPENSLIGFREILRAGAEGIEFDLHLSLEDNLMVVHDNDLSINCFGVVTKKTSKKNCGSDIGIRYPIVEKNKFFVGERTAANLREEFDISMGFDLSNIPSADKVLYTKMPELTEVLSLVSHENIKRGLENKPRVKLNIELKGNGTGNWVESAITYFNNRNPISKINSSDVYYISFIQQELLDVLKHNPMANLVLGVPTSMQYINVDDQYNIIDQSLNNDRLKEVICLNEQIKLIKLRQGRGLDGVDMSIWDVSDDSIKFFCGLHKLPIHLAIVPFSAETLNLGYIIPVLSNFWKIIDAQNKYFNGNTNISIFVKTDEPIRLRERLRDMQFNPNNEREILDVQLFAPNAPNLPIAYTISGHTCAEQNIQLFLKANQASKLRMKQ